MSDDLDLWHIRQLTPARSAKLMLLLLETPYRKMNVSDVLARLDGDKLKEMLALLLDVPPEWVARFYNLVGASQVIGEFLSMDMDAWTEVEKIKKSTKAKAILREASDGW